MPFGISPLQLILVLAIILLVFGAKKIPEMARGLGKGAREFKEGLVHDEPQAPAPDSPPRLTAAVETPVSGGEEAEVVRPVRD
jgi:sec-independent protein translocase protein TatA